MKNQMSRAAKKAHKARLRRREPWMAVRAEMQRFSRPKISFALPKLKGLARKTPVSSRLVQPGYEPAFLMKMARLLVGGFRRRAPGLAINTKGA